MDAFSCDDADGSGVAAGVFPRCSIGKHAHVLPLGGVIAADFNGEEVASEVGLAFAPDEVGRDDERMG